MSDLAKQFLRFFTHSLPFVNHEFFLEKHWDFIEKTTIDLG